MITPALVIRRGRRNYPESVFAAAGDDVIFRGPEWDVTGRKHKTDEAVPSAEKTPAAPRNPSVAARINIIFIPRAPNSLHKSRWRRYAHILCLYILR